jgi:hypothetical protein
MLLHADRKNKSQNIFLSTNPLGKTGGPIGKGTGLWAFGLSILRPQNQQPLTITLN